LRVELKGPLKAPDRGGNLPEFKVGDAALTKPSAAYLMRGVDEKPGCLDVEKLAQSRGWIAIGKQGPCAIELSIELLIARRARRHRRLEHALELGQHRMGGIVTLDNQKSGLTVLVLLGVEPRTPS
jgi:hypothetical protein